MDNDLSQKITSSMATTVIAIIAILPTTFVYAQTTTAGTNGTTTNAVRARLQLVTP